MAITYNPRTVTDGLVLALDAGNPKSYNGSNIDEGLYTISGGSIHTAVIKTDGTLWTWGFNDTIGTLGNASSIDTSTPVTTFAGGTNWKQVSCSSFSTAAIKTDGTLWTWGFGDNGRLGNAVTTNTSTPVTTFIGGTNWKQVSCGYSSVAAIKTDGTLWTWGGGSGGRLGNNNLLSRSTPVTTFAGGTNWKNVNVGSGHVMAIKTDGTLWVWGFATDGKLGNGLTTGNISTPITTFAGGTNWIQCDGGSEGTAAVKSDGTLWTWGRNANGQLGNASTIVQISTPVTTFTGGTNWRQVVSGYRHTAAIKTDGTLWTWGFGYNGQLGNANTNPYGSSNVSTPITTFAGGTDWKQVNSGYKYHVFAIKGSTGSGQLWAWGNNDYGQLGNASTALAVSTPVTTFAGGTNWDTPSTLGTNWTISGTNWSNLLGTGNNGTLTNGPAYDSLNGGSIVFDGVDDKVTFPNNTISTSAGMTVEVWFKTSSGTKYQDIFDLDDSYGVWIVTNYIGYSGKIVTSFNTNNSGLMSVNYTANNWYQVVLSGSGTSNFMYLNGVQVGTASQTVATSINLNTARIGNVDGDRASEYLVGNVSSLKIYNRALTASEVSQNFNALRSRFGI